MIDHPAHHLAFLGLNKRSDSAKWEKNELARQVKENEITTTAITSIARYVKEQSHCDKQTSSFLHTSGFLCFLCLLDTSRLPDRLSLILYKNPDRFLTILQTMKKSTSVICLVSFFALIYTVVAIPIPIPNPNPNPEPVFCPACYVGLASFAGSGGALTAAAELPLPVTIGASAAMSVPWYLNLVDDYKYQNITFTFPRANETLYTCNTYKLTMNTAGLSSFWHLRSAKIYLLNVNNASVYGKNPILQFSEDDLFTELHRHPVLRMAEEGKMETSWTVPNNLSNGSYRFRYHGGWKLYDWFGRFDSISHPFHIKQGNGQILTPADVRKNMTNVH